MEDMCGFIITIKDVDGGFKHAEDIFQKTKLTMRATGCLHAHQCSL